ncbi:MAG: hypothetical protein WCR73_03120, partial [Acholeplasmataceae bacterium]
VKMFLSKNLVAYCYSAYNITEPVRAKLMAALEKQKITAGISDTRFQAIKNYTYLDDLLNEYTWGGSRELPEGSISSFDALIRDEYAKEVTKIKDNELEAQKNVYESRIGKLNEEASRKLEEEKETNAIRNANNANNDYRLAQIGIKIVLNVFFVLVALFFVYYSFTNFFVDNLIVAGIAYGIGAIIPFALTIINILSKGKTLSTWLLSLFRKKLVKKYFLHDGFQFDSRICKQKNNRRGT